MALTKKEALKQFRQFYRVSKTDSIANREAFNNFTDSLCKNREITLKQYETWSNPF